MPNTYFLIAVLIALTSQAFVISSSICLAQLIAKDRNIMVRGTISIVLYVALELGIFWLLAPLNQFNNLNVFLVFGSLFLSSQYINAQGGESTKIPLSESMLFKKFYLRPSSPVCILSVITIALTFLHMVASCILPVIGWDYVAYRGLKAALFVQNEGLFTFALPGGWQFYKLMPANTEVLFSYLMLGTNNDVLVSIFDFVLFFLLPLPIWAYTYERSNPEWRWVQALLIWWLPLLREGVGFAQTETELAFFMMAATLFLLEAFKDGNFNSLGLCGLSLGIGYGIKPIILPQIAIFGLFVCFVAVKYPRTALKTLTVFCLSFLLPSLPWIIYSLRETGLPLSPLPVSFLGIRFGNAPQALEWYMSRVESVPYVLFEEVGQLSQLFLSWHRLAFGYLGCAELVLLFITIPVAYRRSKLATTLCLTTFFSGLIALLMPSMRLNRVFYHSGRYLLHSVSALFFIFERPSRNILWYLIPIILITFLILNAVPRTRYYPVSGTQFLLLLFATIPIALYLIRLGSRYLRVGITIVLLSLCTALATYLRANSVLDYFKLTEKVNPEYYWVQALPSSVYFGKGHKIAVTAGPYQRLTNHLLFHFLGFNFQNTLLYVPPVPVESGKAVLFPDAKEAAAASDKWINKLVSEKIGYVLSLKPRSVEMQILTSSPAIFRPLINHADWGIFCVVPVGECQ